MEAIVEEGVHGLGDHGGERTAQQAQSHALRQPSCAERFARQAQRVSPSCREVKNKTGCYKHQADAAVFDEQLQPIVVRMDRTTIDR